MTTVFSKIIRGELPADRVYENEHVVAFKDIHPKAPVHILIVPKKEIQDIQSVAPEDLYLIGEMVKAAQIISKELGVPHYRLLTNNGAEAGQVIFHLHFHFIAGKTLGSIG